VAVIELRVGFVAGDAELVHVHDHDAIAHIDVRREFRLVLAAQPMRERCREPPQHLVLRIDDVPVVRDFVSFRGKCLHITLV
jgi:hypothetical protein